MIIDNMNSVLQMLANAADGAFVIDEDQRIVFWNQTAQELLGYTADEAVGLACYEVLNGCDEDKHQVCCRDCYVAVTALAGESVTNYDVAARTKSGELRWLNVSTLVLPAADGNSASLIIHLLRDATPEKKNQQFIRQMLETASQLQQAFPAAPPITPPETPPQVLTGREREVLSLLARGLSTGDIAATLSISASTARNHVQNILNKLEVHSRLEAVAYAFEHGLVDND